MDAKLQPENEKPNDDNQFKGFQWKNPESLKLCTEVLGFESMNLTEESMNESEVDWITHQKEKEGKKSITKDNLNEKEKEEKKCITKDNPNVFRRSKTTIKSFPPPLTCFGPSGKPRVCFTAYRFDGRLILKENKLPKEGFLHASREDGTLKIKLIKPDEEIPEEEEEEEKEEEEEEAKVDDDEKEDEEI